MAYTPMRTKNGYCYYEAMSAFQKSIRRCIEDETVFWGIELYESGYISHLWNRLIIIAHEDIGLAVPDITQKILAYKHAHDYLAEKRPKRVSKKLVFLQCLIDFARMPKSRYTDLAYSVYWFKHDQLAIGKDVPDYALDMHTRRGKAKKRGLDHFYSSSAHIENDAGIPGEVEFRKLAREIDIEEYSNPTPHPKQDHSQTDQKQQSSDQQGTLNLD